MTQRSSSKLEIKTCRRESDKGLILVARPLLIGVLGCSRFPVAGSSSSAAVEMASFAANCCGCRVMDRRAEPIGPRRSPSLPTPKRTMQHQRSHMGNRFQSEPIFFHLMVYTQVPPVGPKLHLIFQEPGSVYEIKARFLRHGRLRHVLFIVI